MIQHLHKCVHVYIADERFTPLEEANITRVPMAQGVVNVLDRYQQSDLYRENCQQLQKTLNVLLEEEQRGGEGKVKAATYATNFLWQVSAYTCRERERT